jgi:hypothetical protein
MAESGAKTGNWRREPEAASFALAMALTIALVSILMPGLAHAASGPKWSSSELAAFADVVVTGRVRSVTSAWDSQVNTIYTYVTVDVAEVLKGDIADRHITIKQLGGVAGEVGLSITDQAQFTVGEDVLLYLEARPRDGTLYTTALWQGKWAVQDDLRGERVAIRRQPRHHTGADDRQLLSSARQSAWAAGKRKVAVDTRPAEVPIDSAYDETAQRASAHFALLGPFRYLHSPYVDVQAGGQPGLAGGGFAELLSAINRWNAAGSAFRYLPGQGNIQARCSSQQLNNGRVTVSFMDPCGEMSNTGGTLALGGSYYLPDGGGTSNGQAFGRAVEGFVINNDSPTALQYLGTPGCFEDIQTHELGHVLGLNHSSDPTALMFGTIDRSACVSGARGLRSDDLQGILFIYGDGSTGSAPSAPPTNVTVANGASAATVSWSAVANSSSQPMTYRVDFRSGHQDGGAVVASLTTAATSITVGIPPGVSGAFNVVITAVNAAGAGPASARVDFTVPSNQASCTTAPPAITGAAGTVTGQYAQVQWNAVAGASSYQLQVGSVRGGDDLLHLTDLGPQRAAGASVPPGFAASQPARRLLPAITSNDDAVSAARDHCVDYKIGASCRTRHESRPVGRLDGRRYCNSPSRAAPFWYGIRLSAGR